MTITFIQDLSESTLIRNTYNLKSYTSRDLADITFLYFLGLQILRSEFETKSFSMAYAKKVNSWSDVDTFRTNGNDLYLLLHVLFGKHNESAVLKLKNQEASKLLIQNLHFDYSQCHQWLMNVGVGKDARSSDQLFLMKLEGMLKIQVGDYRNIRRLVNEWADLEQGERALAMTRLLQAFRARAPKSDILAQLEHVAKKNKLEIKAAVNPETEKGTKTLKTVALGAALATGMIANSIKNFLRDAGKAKHYEK